MDISAPYRAALPSAHGPVLATLDRAGTPLTGRRIAELTQPHVSQRQVSTILRELTRHGLVRVVNVGPANLYELNRAHLAAEAIHQLITMRERLWDRITEHVTTWTHGPDALVVYGSVARGDGTISSDIDVLVVRPERVAEANPAWQDDLTRFAAQLTEWTGNPVDLLDHTYPELTTMALAGERLLHHIRNEGRFLVGRRDTVPEPLED